MFLKLYLRTFAALMLFACSACAAQPPYERVRKSVYRMETGVGQCTATAVGPNLMISAQHCGVTSPGRVLLDGKPADVEEVIADGRDHVLFRVSVRFDRWARIGRAPKPGDRVFVIGNPESLRDLLRLGYFAGRVDAQSPEGDEDVGTDMFDIEGGHGDSGAAIFNAKGEIIGILTGGYTPTNDFRLIRAIPMDFTPTDWREIAQ